MFTVCQHFKFLQHVCSTEDAHAQVHGACSPCTAHFMTQMLVRSTEEAYVQALDDFIKAAGITKPIALVVQGFVTAQYGLLWALQNEDRVARLLILNTPLALSSKLRPVGGWGDGRRPGDGWVAWIGSGCEGSGCWVQLL